ncbi:protein hobbit-like isoform X2 [Lineus longissimus]|uniref:protein hobbit-like isoform X2 n=1 Tax=Lineus longissimus TaxID=88925 RepID=UPI00315C504D
MPSIVWVLLLVLFSCWFITRLLAWILVWVFHRYLKVELRVGKVGFFTIRKIKIILNQNTTLDIDRVWCSSSLINNEIRKPIALCLGDVRLQTEAQDPSVTGMAVETPAPASTTSAPKKKAKIGAIISVLQYIGIHIYKVNVMLLKVPFPECLFHITIQEVGLDCPVEETGQSLMLNVQSVSCKVLKDQTSHPCIAEVSFSKTVFMHLESGTILPPKSLKMIIAKPQMKFTEGFLAQLQHLRQQRKRSLPAVSLAQSSRSLEEKLQSISGFLPRNILWKIENTSVVICRDSTPSPDLLQQEEAPDLPTRNLSVSIKSVQLSANQDVTETSPFYGDCAFTLVDFHTSSPQAKFAILNRIEATLKVRSDLLELGCQVYSAYLVYHHEEILYWAAVLRKLSTPKLERETHVSTERSRTERRNTMTEFLSNKTIKADIQVWDLSTSVAMATCSGYVGGLRHSQMTLSIQPSASGIGSSVAYWRNCIILTDFQLDTLYCKLADCSVAVDQLDAKQHHWNTLLYLGLISCNLRKSHQDIMLDTSLHDLQFEWSTTAVNVAIQLITAMKKTQPAVPTIKEGDMPVSSPKSPELKSMMQSYSVQFKCSNVNVFACNAKRVFTMLRVDSINIDLSNKQSNLNIIGAKLVSSLQKDKSYRIRNSAEIEGYVGHLKDIKAHIRGEQREVSITLNEEVYVQWDTSLHMCFYQIMQDVLELKKKTVGVSKREEKSTPKQTSLASKPPICINVKMRANVMLRALLSRGHKATFSTPEFSASVQGSKISLFSDQCSIAFDEHDIFQMQGASIYTMHHSEELKLERMTFDLLELPTNKAWAITFDKFGIIFPYKYHFSKCLSEVLAIKKFIKMLHFKTKKPFTIDRPLPPDIVIRAKTVSIQVCDDPFEVKLADNYALLVDECRESAKRISAMDRRIQDLRKQHGLLPASKVDELYSSLHQRNSDIYVKRSLGQYTTHPLRTALFTWKMDAFELIAMADRAFHGKENCVKHMKDIDKDSPYPEEGLEFNTLFCRMINTSVKTWTISLRDYPQPFFDYKDMHVWGRFMAAEQEGAPRAKREATVEIASPWEDMIVKKNMPALKFYHDFSCDVESITIAYGAAWEPCIAQFNHALDLINKPSVDPSRPMPFWDKFRLLLHGRLTMSIQQMSWLYHASLDPYNRTEFMDWTWSDLILDWTSAKFVFKCNFDIYLRTASKYDDCRLLHLPNLRFCINLQWLCRGDPMDHHSVMPCAPDKKPEFSLEQEHDSYRAFRSQNLNLSLSYETKPCTDEEGFDDIPCCLFYASTLRFLEKIKMCMLRVSRPIKRGKLYNTIKPKKRVLSRHYKNVTLSLNFHMCQVCYWASFAKQLGMEMLGDNFNLGLGMHLEVNPVCDTLLKRRPQSSWSIKKLICELHEAQTWLCSTLLGEQEDVLNKSMRNPVNRSYFLSVSRLLYEREEEKGDAQQPLEAEQSLQEEEEEGNQFFFNFASNTTTFSNFKWNQLSKNKERPTHRVRIYDLKGAWTLSNRNVIFGLFDGYLKATALKRSLSSEAMKGFKVEGTQTPMKGRTHSLTASSPCIATPSPQSRIQLGHAYSLLQKLVSETDSKFVAFTEEPSGGNMEQLHGVSASQTDDVLKRNWLIELHNSQMMLKGCETAGYVIVSASKAQILSCQHQAVWRDRQLKTKTTWMGSVECMQYYATVDGGLDKDFDDPVWLTMENIEDRAEEDFEGTPEMVGSGQSVGGVVTKMIGASGEECTDNNSVQLQRIISRCKCQFFYASYGEADPNTLPEVPPPPSEDDKYLERTFEEGVDAFTLLHHDLNICTNSLQYAMVLDIVNNLLLYVEPKKKQFTEKLQSRRFKQQLSSIEDQKTPILQMQEELRQSMVKLRQLERDLYTAHRILDENPFAEGPLQQCEVLVNALNALKEQVNNESEELGIMISCFMESQLQIKHKMKAQNAKQSLVVRRNEVCFKHAQWRLTESDGQIGLADLVLRNFLYCKINNNDDSGCHQLELGWAKMQNLLPNSIYKDVLVPQDPLGKGHLERQVALRILCRVKPPVGGISVKEHVEVNVVPLTIQMTNQFFRTLMKFFFPGRNVEAEDEKHDEQASGKSKKKEDSKSGFKAYVPLDTDIDKMKERAARNNTFLYVKIPEVPMKISYKGEKEKNISDVHDIAVVLPPVEFHNQTWTWLDMLLAIKNNSKKALLTQAIKQKLHMRSRMGDDMVTDVQQEEDKAKMLLGAKLLSGSEKHSTKKNLFGKTAK